MTSGPEAYIANALNMWSSIAVAVYVAPNGMLGVATPDGRRYLIRRPLAPRAIAAALEKIPPGVRAVVEDSYGVRSLPVAGAFAVMRMPVMNRAPDPVAPSHSLDVTVSSVADAAMLTHAERVIVDGFPRPHLQPWIPGRALPTQVLELPGWRVWLASRSGEPAAAGYTYDDGNAVGVYWLATLPQHRGAGVGRAMMTAMLTAHAGRTATLVATAAGVPLYESLGFATVSTATWYIQSA